MTTWAGWAPGTAASVTTTSRPSTMPRWWSPRRAAPALHSSKNLQSTGSLFFWSLQKFMIFSASTYMVPKYLVIRRDFCTALRMRSKFGIISSGQPHSGHSSLRPEQSSVWAWAVCEVKMNIIWIPLLSTLFHRLVITNKYKLKIKEEANVRSVKYKKNKTDNLSTLVHPQRKSFIMKHLSVSALRLKLWRLPLFNTFYRIFDCCHQLYHVRLLSSLRNPSEMLCFT